MATTQTTLTIGSNITDYGFWKRTVGINNVGGTSTVVFVCADNDFHPNGLSATDVSFTTVGSNVLIQVKGELSKTYNWTAEWEIIRK